MKLDEIMYILNLIVKQLYVLANHKVLILIGEIISRRRYSHKNQRRGRLSPSSGLRFMSLEPGLKNVPQAQRKQVNIRFISPVGGAVGLSDEGTERISEGVIFIPVFVVLVAKCP